MACFRDSQKRRLYRAEQAVRNEWGKEFASPEEVRAYIEQVVQTDWYEAEGYPVPAVLNIKTSNRKRGTATGGGYRSPKGPRFELYFPRWAWTQFVVLHELAHCVQQIVDRRVGAGHGVEFTRILLTMIRHEIGDAAAEAFQKAMDRFGVNRKERAKELRDAGLTYAEVAERLGYANPGAACNAVRRAKQAAKEKQHLRKTFEKNDWGF